MSVSTSHAHRALFAAMLLASPAWAGPAPAAIAGWTRYIQAVEARLQADEESHAGLQPRVEPALIDGEISVEEASLPDGTDVPGAKIHHWRGRVLIRDTSLDRLIASVRDPASHRQEDVLEARLLGRDGDVDRVYLKIRRSSIVTATYDTEHTVEYRTLAPGRVVSRSVATKIAELDAVGTPAEHERPPGTDRGFLWRMNAYWRYERVPEGVLVTLESVTLSRDVPWIVAPIASPIVNRIARESVTRTLSAIRDNARGAQPAAHRLPPTAYRQPASGLGLTSDF